MDTRAQKLGITIPKRGSTAAQGRAAARKASGGEVQTQDVFALGPDGPVLRPVPTGSLSGRGSAHALSHDPCTSAGIRAPPPDPCTSAGSVRLHRIRAPENHGTDRALPRFACPGTRREPRLPALSDSWGRRGEAPPRKKRNLAAGRSPSTKSSRTRRPLRTPTRS